MKLTLLGTGCPQVHTRRYGPSSLVTAAEQHVLVDCGSGVTQRLKAAGVSGADIDLLVLTHLHSDHLVDFYQLLVSGWHQGRKAPLKVMGPPGTRAFVEGSIELWSAEREQRLAWEQRPWPEGLNAEVEEFGRERSGEAGTEMEIWSNDGLRIRAIEVDHKPVMHAYGFLFDDGRHRLAFSGDTRFCPPFAKAIRGCDVLVHEVLFHGLMQPGGTRTAAGTEAIASYHTLDEEVGQVATLAGAGCLVLNHFVPTVFDSAQLLAKVRAHYAGPVVVGEDLMSLDLTTRAVTHANLTMGL